MKRYLIFLILILMLPIAFSLTFIETYSNDPDTIYGDNDNIINFTSRWLDAQYVIANFSKIDKVNETLLLSSSGSGKIEWNLNNTYEGDFSVLLEAQKITWAPNFVANESRIRILFDNVKLKDIENISWMVYTNYGYVPHVDILLDIDNDGEFKSKKDLESGDLTGNSDDVLVAEYAYNPLSHYYEGSPYDNMVDYKVWKNTFSDNNSTSIIDNKTMLWLYSAMPGAPGCKEFLFYNLSKWKNSIKRNWTDNCFTNIWHGDNETINKNTKVYGVEIEVDGWIIGSSAYIDDIKLNDKKVYSDPVLIKKGSKTSVTQYDLVYLINDSVDDGIYAIPITGFGSNLTDNSFNVTIDNTKPSITGPKQNPEIVFEYTDVRLNYTITDDNWLSEVLILGNWEGVWKDYTAEGNLSGGSGMFSYLINSSYLQSGENVSWRFFAKDKANNFKNGTLRSFVVKNRTSIILDPTIPDGNNGYYVTLPLIILKSDATANNTYYKWDALELLKYTSPFYFDWNNTFGGIEVIHFFSEFSGSSINETSQNKTIKVDITKPEIEDIYPLNGSLLSSSLVNISTLLNDIYESNSGINESSIILKIDNIPVNATIFNISKQKTIVWYLVSLFNGWHNVSLYVEDNAGLSNYLNWTFSVDTSMFLNITVSSPTNKIYNDNKLLINISLNREAKEIQYKTDEKFRRLCKDCQNYTKKKTFDEGNNTITIRTVDESNSYNEKTINFFIDSKKPNIEKTTPKKGFSNGTFVIRYKEENLKQIDLYYKNNSITKTNCPSSNKSDKKQECPFSINLSPYENQEVSYYFKIEDIAGNKDTSKNYTITSDTKPSLLTINEPLNKIYNKYVIFNITLDSEADLRYIENNKERILCNRCSEYGFTKQKKKRFSNGLHNLTIISIDKAGNSDTKNIQFEVI